MQWVMDGCTYKKLKALGFKCIIRQVESKKRIGKDREHIERNYILKFPIYQANINSKVASVFICKITAYPDNRGKVTVDLYNEHNDYYPQFYNLTNNGFADFISQINNIILNKFNSLDIRKKGSRRKKRVIN